MLFFMLVMGIIECHSCLECPEKYRNLSEKHVMCVKLNGTCVETEDIEPLKDLLDYHNTIRNMRSSFNFNLPAAADMLMMEWDEELFEMAKRYALQCPDSPDCQNCFQSDRFPVRQNFAIRRLSAEESFNPMKQIERFKDVILEWAKESINNKVVKKDSFRISQNISRNWINLFQSKINKLGCATSYFKSSGDSYKEVYICNYALANYSLDQNLYKKDKPCSKCPPGYQCDSKYTQLCARETTKVNKEIATRSVPEIASFTYNLSNCAATSGNCLLREYCSRKTDWAVTSNNEQIMQLEVKDKSNYTVTLMFFRQLGILNSGCLTFQYKIKSPNPSVTLGIAAVIAPDRNEYFMNRVMVKNENWNTLSKYTHWKDHRFLLAFHIMKTPTIIKLKNFVFNEGHCLLDD